MEHSELHLRKRYYTLKQLAVRPCFVLLKITYAKINFQHSCSSSSPPESRKVVPDVVVLFLRSPSPFACVICITFQLPVEFLSSGRALLLRFRSDDNINSKGFSVAYDIRSFGDGQPSRGNVDPELESFNIRRRLLGPYPDEPT